MMRPIILLDIDGVVANFDKIILDYFSQNHNIKIDLGQETDLWDVSDFPEVRHLSEEVWDYILGTKDLIRNIELYPGAKDFVHNLRSLGHVIACTSSVFPGGHFSS